MIETADRAILAMDSSKMGRYTLASVGGIDVLDALVTDEYLAAEDRAAIEAQGVMVLAVSVSNQTLEPVKEL